MRNPSCVSYGEMRTFIETEFVGARLWYGKCAYNVRNDINTEHLVVRKSQYLYDTNGKYVTRVLDVVSYEFYE